MRITGSTFALAVVVGMLGLPLSGAAQADDADVARGAAGSAHPASERSIVPDTELSVELVPSGSGVVSPGSALNVGVTVTNRGVNTIAGGSATVYLGKRPIIDRADLGAWLGADVTSEPGGSAVATVTVPGLSPGQSTTLPTAAVLVPESDAQDFGARQLAVSIEVDGEIVSGARSAVTVVPSSAIQGPGAEQRRIAFAMPLTLPATDAGLIPADQLEILTSPSGLLTTQLDQASGQEIAIGIDPRVIVSIRVLGDSAPGSATEWLERLRRVPNPTFSLAYADSDIAATSQSGAGVLAPAAFTLDPDLFPPVSEDGEDQNAEPTPSPSSDTPSVPSLAELLDWEYTLDGIAWPRENTVISSDLETFAAAGDPITMVTSADLVDDQDERSAAVTVGEHRLLTADSTISTLFRQAVTAESDAEWQSAMAPLTAAMAAAAAAETEDPLLATLGREQPYESYRLVQTLSALATTPWVTPVGISSVIGDDPDEATIDDSPVPPDRLQQIGYLLTAESATTSFSTVLDDPASIVGERRLALMALLSQGWATDETGVGWPAAVAGYLSRSNEIVGSVQVLTSDTFNLLADRGSINVPVSNVLDVPVTVYVEVRPQSAIIDVSDRRVPVTVEANSQRSAPIPVQSIANGEVTVAISLTSESGVPIGQVNYADINVRAGWENTATTVLGIIVAGVFVAGVIRTVRRRRRLRSEAAEAATASVSATPGQAGRERTDA